jgi:hypothetical protein
MNMDKGLLNGVIFLDLKKAFDCVDHLKLMYAPQTYFRKLGQVLMICQNAMILPYVLFSINMLL